MQESNSQASVPFNVHSLLLPFMFTLSGINCFFIVRVLVCVLEHVGFSAPVFIFLFVYSLVLHENVFTRQRLRFVM